MKMLKKEVDLRIYRELRRISSIILTLLPDCNSNPIIDTDEILRNDTEDSKEQKEEDDESVQEPNPTEDDCTENQVNEEIRQVSIFCIFRKVVLIDFKTIVEINRLGRVTRNFQE